MYSKREFSYLYVCFSPLIGRENPIDGSLLINEEYWIFPRKVVQFGRLSTIIRGVYVFFNPLSIFLLIPPSLKKSKKTPLFVKITKSGVSNYNPDFPFDTVIRLTAR